jgi:predicted anti-sigma-YlaC factor YlaD
MNSIHLAPDTRCLTSDQLADLFLTEDPSALSLASRRRHLGQCPTCRAEFHQLEALLGALHDSAHTQASLAHQQARREAQSEARSIAAKQPSRRILWAVAATSLALLSAIATPLVRHHAATTVAVAPAAAAPVARPTDEALLEGISQDLSASVPSSLDVINNPANSQAYTLAVDDDDTTTRR